MGLSSPAASAARIALTSWLNATRLMNTSLSSCSATLSKRAWMWIDLPSDHSNRPCSRGLVCVSVIAFILQFNEVLVVFLLVHRGEEFRWFRSRSQP